MGKKISVGLGAVVLLPLFFTAQATTYLLTVSACPPWKNIQFYHSYQKTKFKNFLNAKYACQNTVNLMSQALKKHYQIKEKNIYRLVDKKVTYKKLSVVLTQLQQKIKSNDTFIAYFALHGGPFKFMGHHQELLLLWSQKTPANLLATYLSGNALDTADLSSALNSINSQKKLVILEACHSQLAVKNFKPDEYTTFITSSGHGESSYFTYHYNYPLFSKLFALTMLNSPSNTHLVNIFKTAEQETTKESIKICKQLEEIDFKLGYKDDKCNGQHPTITINPK